MNSPLTQSLQVIAEVDLAYMRGLIDGEGTVGIYPTSHRIDTVYPTVILQLNSPPSS